MNGTRHRFCGVTTHVPPCWDLFKGRSMLLALSMGELRINEGDQNRRLACVVCVRPRGVYKIWICTVFRVATTTHYTTRINALDYVGPYCSPNTAFPCWAWLVRRIKAILALLNTDISWTAWRGALALCHMLFVPGGECMAGHANVDAFAYVFTGPNCTMFAEPSY